MKEIRSLSVLFLGLCLSALATAQADVTLFVTTNIDCNWKLDGRPMGRLKADHAKVVPVSPGEHFLQADTTDGLATIRTKAEVNSGQRVVEIELMSQYIKKFKKQEEAQAALNPTWTDAATGLMWAKMDNGSDVDWNQANAYCSNLHLANSSDWRLPTIDELQGIYEPSVSTKTVFDYGVEYVHVKGNLKLTGWFWSSSQGDYPGKPWQTAWSFVFHHGPGEPAKFFGLGFSYNTRALCVRSFGE